MPRQRTVGDICYICWRGLQVAAQIDYNHGATSGYVAAFLDYDRLEPEIPPWFREIDVVFRCVQILDTLSADKLQKVQIGRYGDAAVEGKVEERPNGGQVRITGPWNETTRVKRLYEDLLTGRLEPQSEWEAARGPDPRRVQSIDRELPYLKL